MSSVTPPQAETAAGPPRPGRWTVLELLRWTTRHFEARGIDTARLDAECLLAFALGRSRLELYLDFENEVPPEARTRFRELVRRRGGERVPVSQLVGRKEFWSLSLRVTGDVLTPRPETETLVEAALALLPDPEGQPRVLDLRTGSGAVALALAKERPGARITASDISSAALQIAARNADELQLSDGICFVEGSLFAPVEGERFDLVVSNPPYLARSVSQELAPELAFEPEAALFAGDDGLAVLRPLVSQVSGVLRPAGGVALEVDPGQAERVAAWCAQAGLEQIQILRDLAQRLRVVVARRPEAPPGGGPTA